MALWSKEEIVLKGGTKVLVTFDSNVVEEILDAKKRVGDAEKVVFEALKKGIIKGFVARTYFTHDAIQRNSRRAALCNDVEIRIPANPNLYRNGVGLMMVQTSRTKLNEHNESIISSMRALNMEVLDFRRKLWPELEIELPTRNIPADYNCRAKEIQKVIEDELHCGFNRFRAYLEQEIGEEGSDFSLLVRLRGRECCKREFNAAFAEAADGDALIAHYGYGIEFFCTNDRAAKAGSQSVFSQSNRKILKEKFKLEIVSPSQLAEIIKKHYRGTDHA